MEKYNFLTYKAKYDMSDIFISPNGNSISFSCRQTMDARYDSLSGLYMFTWAGRDGVCINGRPLTNAMDMFMQKMGDLLLPLSVMTDKHGAIQQINKFDDYKARWEKSVCLLQEKCGQSLLTANYIKMCYPKISTERKLMEALSKNTFFYHYFLVGKNPVAYLSGFPCQKEFLLKLVSDEKDEYEMEEERYEMDNMPFKASTYILRDEYGVIEKCVSSFLYSGEDGDYRKDVMIKMVSESRNVKKRSWLTF